MDNIKCPYCNSKKVEYVDMLDHNLDSYCCRKCEDYFYVETYKEEVKDVRKSKCR